MTDLYRSFIFSKQLLFSKGPNITWMSAAISTFPPHHNIIQTSETTL